MARLPVLASLGMLVLCLSACPSSEDDSAIQNDGSSGGSDENSTEEAIDVPGTTTTGTDPGSTGAGELTTGGDDATTTDVASSGSIETMGHGDTTTSGGDAGDGFPMTVPSYLWLDDPLDEPEGYCLDITGFGANTMLDAPLNAHTCKLEGNEDMLFVFGSPSSTQIYNPAFDRCVEASAANDGATIGVSACADVDAQQWRLTAQDQLELGTSGLCVTVGAEPGQPTGGPSHLVRSLALRGCDASEASLSTWSITPPM